MSQDKLNNKEQNTEHNFDNLLTNKEITMPNTRAARDKNPLVLAFISAADEFVKYCIRFQQTPISDNTESVLMVKTVRIENMWDKFEKAYDAVKNLEDLSVPEGFKVSAENKFHDCINTLELTQAQMADQMKMLNPEALNHTTVQTQAQEQPASTGNYFQVPPCDTQVFHGTYEDWPSFRDMFTAVYINHPKLSPAQKLYYLTYKTKGKALDLVKTFPLTDGNFQLAWNALSERYENRRALVERQVKTLMNLPTVHSPETSEAIQRLQSSINNCLSILKTQGINTYNWDPILTYVCCSKLPEATLVQWEQSLTDRKVVPKWEQLDAFLTTRYEVVERLQSMQISQPKPQYQTHVQNHQFNSQGNSHHNNSHNHSQKPDTQIRTSCKACNAQHPLKMCQKFLSLQHSDKMKLLRQHNICENCLAYSHTTTQCQSKFSCA
jgi:hypothetical protein